MSGADRRQAVLLRLSGELNEGQELIKQNLPAIRKSVRKLIRKFDIFNPVDVVRPLCVSYADEGSCLQLRLTQNSDFMFTSEDLSSKSPWADIPFVTIILERQPSAVPEQSQNESDKHADPQNVNSDAAAKLVELSTRLEKVESLLDSAMCSATKGSNDPSLPLAKESTPNSGNVKQVCTKSPPNVTPQAVLDPVDTTTASRYPPSKLITKKVGSSAPKSKAAPLKTSVGKGVAAVTVSSRSPPGNNILQVVKSTPMSKGQPPTQTITLKANLPQNKLKRPLATIGNINTSSEAPPSKQHIQHTGLGDGSEYVWRTPASYLANFDETIESVVAGLDDPNDFTIEPPSTQTAFDSTICTTTVDFDEFVHSLPAESFMNSVKKKKKKKQPILQEQLVV
ncbi:unnamed protein product [Hydatigera taeniaeformis]|uniref:Uncharacterized protein n=1 Tax=Hydatigena taeniaeformis TaxID=6205 RepID=A0A0R3X8P9_HYDTA|nr:unnamed protein product [Hydatigera taeniaeformis]